MFWCNWNRTFFNKMTFISKYPKLIILIIYLFSILHVHQNNFSFSLIFFFTKIKRKKIKGCVPYRIVPVPYRTVQCPYGIITYHSRTVSVSYRTVSVSYRKKKRNVKINGSVRTRWKIRIAPVFNRKFNSENSIEDFKLIINSKF